MWIGGTMTVPGVSGGSMAMIMGVYDRLISSISSFFKEPAGSMAFLLKFVLGAGTGMVLFSRFISYLFTTRADVPLRFFFLGAVAGGVPMIYREAGVKKLDLGGRKFRARGPAPSAGWGIHHCGGAGPARNQRVSDALYAGNL